MTRTDHLWVKADANGNPIAPRTLECVECEATMRRLPGNRYKCPDCEAVTTLDMTVVVRRTFKKK